MKLPHFEDDSRFIVWPDREKPLTIDGPHRRPASLGERIAAVALATVVGIVLAAALVHWWSAA